jgi:hypothetical protein
LPAVGVVVAVVAAAAALAATGHGATADLGCSEQAPCTLIVTVNDRGT